MGKFYKQLNNGYNAHLRLPLCETLDQSEIDRLLKVSNEITEIMGKTDKPVDVLKFLFTNLMDETRACELRVPQEEDECSCVNSGYEEEEMELTTGERDAVNMAHSLAQGKARGGLLSTVTGGMVGDPTKNIQKAYGEILNALSTRLTQTANKIKQGGTTI